MPAGIRDVPDAVLNEARAEAGEGLARKIPLPQREALWGAGERPGAEERERGNLCPALSRTLTAGRNDSMRKQWWGGELTWGPRTTRFKSWLSH